MMLPESTCMNLIRDGLFYTIAWKGGIKNVPLVLVSVLSNLKN